MSFFGKIFASSVGKTLGGIVSTVEPVCSTEAFSSESDLLVNVVGSLEAVVFTGVDTVEAISCDKDSFDNGSSAADKNAINE